MPAPPLITPQIGIDGVEIRVTTRLGGVSQPPYDTLNLGDHVGDRADHVRENRDRVGGVIPGDAMNWLKQVHGARVVEATDGSAPEADGQWTRERHRPLALLTADCLPVVLATEDARCVGIAHAGWRGLAAGVLESLVSAMPVRGASVVAWLGPAISAAAYEVGPEVKATFENVLGEASSDCFTRSLQADGHWMADLALLARLRLRRAGISVILGGDRCTYGEPEHFFSHRREGPATGRMATIVWRS